MHINDDHISYLTRSQIYRALFRVQTGITPQDPSLVFKDFDPESEPQYDEDFMDRLEEEFGGADGLEATVGDAAGESLLGLGAYYQRRHLGVTLRTDSNAARTANIGEPGLADPQRIAWYDVLHNVKALLNRLHNGVTRTNFNPPLVEIETDEELLTVEEIETPTVTQTLYVRTQDILNRFRSVVYAGNDQESNIRRRYFDAAFASTPARSRVIPVNNTYVSTLSTFKALRRWGATRPQPDLFTFNDPADNYTNQAKFAGTRLIVRLCALHNALYGSEIKPFNTNITKVKVSLSTAKKMVANCQAGLAILEADITEYITTESERADALDTAQEEVIEEAIVETGFSIGRLDSAQIDIISNNEKYKEYFSTTFNQDLITAVPLIHNLYLTTKYFPQVEDVFLGPKNTTLDLLRTTILGDEEFPTEPDLSRPAAEAAIANANGMSPEEFGLNAGKFVLKMLINAPIQILKGLVELIDPHVLVTKLIKVGSATGFQKAAKTLDPAAETINKRLKDDLELESNLTGKNLMTLILCLADYGFEQGDAGLQAGLQSVLGEDFNPPGNFFPDVSMKGIDFTGTVTGMLMIPPTPLGLIYLLLELVKSEIDGITLNVDDAAAENAEDNQC